MELCKERCKDCGRFLGENHVCASDDRRCKDCGRFLGKNHICANVDLKGERHCNVCDCLISNEGWQRWSKVCRLCAKKKWRDKERAERLSLKQSFGGKCNRCGYSKCNAALHFHHNDSSEKKTYSKKGSSNLKELRLHPERFELLCANCHFEEHNLENEQLRIGVSGW